MPLDYIYYLYLEIQWDNECENDLYEIKHACMHASVT